MHLGIKVKSATQATPATPAAAASGVAAPGGGTGVARPSPAVGGLLRGGPQQKRTMKAVNTCGLALCRSLSSPLCVNGRLFKGQTQDSGSRHVKGQ